MEYEPDDDDTGCEDRKPAFSDRVDIPKLDTHGAGSWNALRTTPQIVQGLIRAGDIACIYGQPGVGKSVLAPYLGYCIALGRPFFGRPTKARKVLYIAAEDTDGIKWRCRVMYNLLGATENFQISDQPLDLYAPCTYGLDGYSDIDLLIKYIYNEGVSIVIIDTMSRSFPGLEENNHRSMCQLIDNVERIAGNYTAVALVHHDSKADTGRPRGHGSLWARLDTAIYLQRGRSENVNCSIQKNKTRQSGEAFKFSIQVAEVGYDNYLDMITAPVLTEIIDGENYKEEVRNLSKSQLTALRLLDQMGKVGPVSEREWLTACAAGNGISGAAQPVNRLRVTRRLIQTMKDEGLVIAQDGFMSRNLAIPWEDNWTPL